MRCTASVVRRFFVRRTVHGRGAVEWSDAFAANAEQGQIVGDGVGYTP